MIPLAEIIIVDVAIELTSGWGSRMRFGRLPTLPGKHGKSFGQVARGIAPGFSDVERQRTSLHIGRFYVSAHFSAHYQQLCLRVRQFRGAVVGHFFHCYQFVCRGAGKLDGEKICGFFRGCQQKPVFQVTENESCLKTPDLRRELFKPRRQCCSNYYASCGLLPFAPARLRAGNPYRSRESSNRPNGSDPSCPIGLTQFACQSCYQKRCTSANREQRIANESSFEEYEFGCHKGIVPCTTH